MTTYFNYSPSISSEINGFRFINTISNAYQAEEPPQFRGGIIADSMGLGKTLTMIALAATDLDSSVGIANPKYSIDDSEFYTSATLIIMPPTRMIRPWSRSVWHLLTSISYWNLGRTAV